MNANKSARKNTIPGFDFGGSGTGGSGTLEILEGAYISSTVFNDLNGDPYTPATNKLYVDVSADPAICYHWAGSAYYIIGDGGITANATAGKLLKAKNVLGSQVLTADGSAIYDDDDNVTVDLTDRTTGLFTLSAKLLKIFSAGGKLLGNAIGVGLYNSSENSFVSVEESGIYMRSTQPIRVSLSPLYYDSYVPGIDSNRVAIFDSLKQVVTSDISINQLNQLSKTLLSVPIVIDLVTAEAMQAAGTIVNEQSYLIIDFPGTDLGLVILGSPNPRKFYNSGKGGFLNCDYDGSGDYDLVESITGILAGDFKGQWSALTENTYALGDTGYHDGIIWQLINRGLINGNSPSNNTDAYRQVQKINFQTERVGYHQIWDNVDVYAEDHAILFRYCSRFNNAINSASLSYFQFGFTKVRDISMIDSVSVIQCINNTGEIKRLTFEGGSSLDATLNKGNIMDGIFGNQCICEIVLNAGFSHAANKYLKAGGYNFPNNKDYSSKELTEEYSSFDAYYPTIIDGDSNLVLNAPSISFAGIIYLQGANPTETITGIQYPIQRRYQYKAVDNTSDFVFQGGNPGASIRIPQQFGDTAIATIIGGVDVLIFTNYNTFTLKSRTSSQLDDVAEFYFDNNGAGYLQKGLNYNP